MIRAEVWAEFPVFEKQGRGAEGVIDGEGQKISRLPRRLPDGFWSAKVEVAFVPQGIDAGRPWRGVEIPHDDGWNVPVGGDKFRDGLELAQRGFCSVFSGRWHGMGADDAEDFSFVLDQRDNAVDFLVGEFSHLALA